MATDLRHRWLEEKCAEADTLLGMSVTEITPSRRDFAMFVGSQKQGITIVPRIMRKNPATGGVWPALEPVEFARAVDDSEAAGIAVATSSLHGGSPDDLRAISAAVSAPILRDDLCLGPEHLYQSRLCGADAVILPAGAVDAVQLVELTRIASSMHMVSVVEVCGPADLDVALNVATAAIGLSCADATGHARVDLVCRLAARIPAGRTVLLLSEPAALDVLRSLEGLIDGAVVGDALLSAPDPRAAIDAITRG